MAGRRESANSGHAGGPEARESVAASYQEYSTSSDYPSRYGRPWLQATAIPLRSEMQQFLHKPVQQQLEDRPRYTQGHTPQPPREEFAQPPADRGYDPLNYSSTSTIHQYEQDRGGSMQHVPGIPRPGPVARLQPPRRRPSTSTGRENVQQTDQSLFQSNSELMTTSMSASESAMTSKQVRDAAYTQWLAEKAAKRKRSASAKAKPSDAETLKTSASSAQVQRVLTPEQLFQDSNHVRQVAYEEWMAKKLAEQQAKSKARRSAEKEGALKAAEIKKNKQEEASSAFDAWKSQKEERLARERAKAAEAAAQQKKIKEAKAKGTKEEAESAFVAWKSRKDEKLSESRQTQCQKERELRAKEQQDKEDQERSSASAFSGW